ncbi:glutamate receptor ionotropic, kainate 5-like, partial [Patagioenas fasciata]|uniref:glutamate receptor ionotropic, kainate 5-like n=1 Tax=Patagioenas fasciata TaxID=372321 RepID=UPI003A9A1BC5
MGGREQREPGGPGPCPPRPPRCRRRRRLHRAEEPRPGPPHPPHPPPRPGGLRRPRSEPPCPHAEGGTMPPAPALLLLLVLLGGGVAPRERPGPSPLRMAAILDEGGPCGGGQRLGGSGAAILDEGGPCGGGQRLALALAREQLNGVLGALGTPPRPRLEVEVFELGGDSQYETTDISELHWLDWLDWVEVFELGGDSQYETTDIMCQILPKGVLSVLGPAASPAAAATVSHICGDKEIPHIKVGPEDAPRPPLLRFAALSLFPSNEDVSGAVGGLLRSLHSPPASLICAQPECLLRLEELVRGFLISRETLSVRVLEGAQDPTPLLKEIRDDKVPVIVIDANASVARLVLSKVWGWGLGGLGVVGLGVVGLE